MKDPFELGKLEKLGAGQAASHPALASTGGGQALPAGTVAPKAAPQQDHVQLSDEVDGPETPGFDGSVNFGAWSAQAQAPEAGVTGLQPGPVFGLDGVSGLEPGMQAGGVHKASELQDF